jgi:hypothetical protein
MVTDRAQGLDRWTIPQRSHWSADMNALWLMVLGLATAVALLIAAAYAKPILAAHSAFSSPGQLPLPGRHFGRRLRRWWRDATDIAPLQPTGPPLRLRAWPMLDLKAGRLAGLLLEPLRLKSVDASAAPDDLARLERATAHGRRLGWRHSSTTLFVPIAAPSSLLASPRGRAWETLERYSGDEVATVPPLVLVIDDLGELPEEAILQRLARLRIGIGLEVQSQNVGDLPDAIDRVFIDAATALTSPKVAETLQRSGQRSGQTSGRQVIVKGVPDMMQLERLARAGLRFATGHVFGAPQLLQ